MELCKAAVAVLMGHGTVVHLIRRGHTEGAAMKDPAETHAYLQQASCAGQQRTVDQEALMRFDPASGRPNPYPSHARQYRDFHGQVAWLYCPWSGRPRHALDVGSDVFGRLIRPPGAQLSSAEAVGSLLNALPAGEEMRNYGRDQ